MAEDLFLGARVDRTLVDLLTLSIRSKLLKKLYTAPNDVRDSFCAGIAKNLTCRLQVDNPQLGEFPLIGNPEILNARHQALHPLQHVVLPQELEFVLRVRLNEVLVYKLGKAQHCIELVGSHNTDDLAFEEKICRLASLILAA